MGNFQSRKLSWIYEKCFFLQRKLSLIARFCCAKRCHTPKFCGENFRKLPQNCKFMKVFSLESFLVYSIGLYFVLQRVMCTACLLFFLEHFIWAVAYFCSPIEKVDQSCKRTRPLSENYDSTENTKKKKAVASKGQVCKSCYCRAQEEKLPLLMHYWNIAINFYYFRQTTMVRIVFKRKINFPHLL